MSQDQPQELAREKRIFLHHIDEYETNAIKKRLMEVNLEVRCSKYELFGSINQPENLVKVMHERHPLEILNSTNVNYIPRILNCDILVFNVNSTNFEAVCVDVRRVIRVLEEWTNDQKKISESPLLIKYLILISTPMTWSLTTTEVITNEEEDDENYGFLLEDDYRRRKAHRSYCKHKLLERDIISLQKKCKHFVKTLVVCPGITYGAENDRFHYIFKLAFYNKPVPIIRPGSQLIPMIYIKDFAQIMEDIFDNFPESKIRYIFAVQPTLISLKGFTYHINKSLNSHCSNILFLNEVETLTMENTLFPQSVLDVLSLNVKLRSSYLKDKSFHEINEEFWNMLAQEFRDARNLHPLRLVLDGPPLVGKTKHAKKLSEYYNIPYIDTREVINEYIKLLETNVKNSIRVVENLECSVELEYEEGKKPTLKTKGGEESHKISLEDKYVINELKEQIEKWSKELFELKVYIASHKAFEDQEFEQVSRCLIELISVKQYNDNQGYVIDGFPFNYDQAKLIFYNTRRANMPVVLSQTNIDAEALGSPNTIAIPPLEPTHFIILDAHDELICKRAMDFTETEAIIRRCLRHQMLPKIDAYRERNTEPFCLANLFYDNDLVPISIFIEQDTLFTDTLRTLKTEIGVPFTYPLSKAQQKQLDKVLAEKRLKEEKEQHRKKEEMIKSLTLERECKLLEWTAKYEEIRKHEDELRQVKTLPLRQYLGKYVLPTLTEGILKIAELKPDDPVDFLAEYLFKCNPEGQQMPPFCTDEQRTRFFDACYNGSSSNSDYFVENDKLKCDESEDE